MANESLSADAKATVSILLSTFLAYTRARSSDERIRLEEQILELFDLLGVENFSDLSRLRTDFNLLRTERVGGVLRVGDIAEEARDFATQRIRGFENVPGNPSLTGPARNMLRIPLSEAAKRSGQFNQEQAETSIDKVLSSLRSAPVSALEGDGRVRTSTAVIRALYKNFCNIPPFCSGGRP